MDSTAPGARYDDGQRSRKWILRERHIEDEFIAHLEGLKYVYRPDIRDRVALEANFREKFEALNHVNLTDGEFARLLDAIVSPDVYTSSKTLRQINAFTRDDGTPLNYTLVNIKDWCKNTFEVDEEPVKYSVEFYAKNSLHPSPSAIHIMAYLLGGEVVWSSRPNERYTRYRVTVEEIV
jgi:hypothetical protein